VHDTSTVRGWWQEGDAVQAFWECLGLPGDAPDEYSSETARTVMEAILETSSALCILQIQDILALSDRVEVLSPESERVNVPGTVNDFNWNYRMPVTLRELARLNDLKSVLGPAVLNRSARPVPDNGNGGGSP
jgi:4-alpha-glucanotransferase